jgi:hypothetical protein
MKPNTQEILRQAQNDNLDPRRPVNRWLLSLTTVFCLLTPVFCSHAQCTFSSGSTGTDGDFNPPVSWPTNTGWSVSNDVATGKTIVTVTNKSDGIFNFRKIYVETNYVVKFTKNNLNTPVYFLAQSNVLINGTIDVSGQNGSGGQGGIGGPGGYDGGGYGPTTQGWGHGPGFGALCGVGDNGAFAYSINALGYCSAQPIWGNCKAYGTIDLLPMIGGSSAAGSGRDGGGGGGGAIVIATSQTFSNTGTILANGGSGNACGSGGAIKLIASTIAGEGITRARPGGGNATEGRIRLEACVNQRVTLTDPPATFGAPSIVFLPTNPTIRVISIAGVNSPWPPAGSLTSPDTYLPTLFTNPAAISVAASNVNPGTNFKIILIPVYGTNMITSNALAGTYAYSTGVVTLAVYTDRVWRVNALIDYIPRP